jgi:glycosyltransferase involved in cell wall biosynthesis
LLSAAFLRRADAQSKDLYPRNGVIVAATRYFAVTLQTLVTHSPIRVLTLIENATVTGPARNVIDYGKMMAQAEGDLPAVEVTIVTYQRGPEPSALALAAREAGLAVTTVAERRRWDTKVFAQLKQVVATINPDILETRNVKSHFLLRLLGLQRKYPWVAWNHGYTDTSSLDRMYTWLDRWSLRGAYRVVTVCQPFADKIADFGVTRDRISILHNAVKPFVVPAGEEVQRVRRDLGLEDHEAMILSVGRLSYEKGHADLIRAAAKLAGMPGTSPFRVVIVGDGRERENLAKLAAHVGLEKSVSFTGFQRDTKPYYALATVVAVPSHSEGSPNVVLEAMAAGLPIVANRVGGIPEILEDGVTGLMVEPRTPETMAKTIFQLLSNADLRSRLGSAARDSAESAHTPEAYRRALVGFYQETLRSVPPP